MKSLTLALLFVASSSQAQTQTDSRELIQAEITVLKQRELQSKQLTGASLKKRRGQSLTSANEKIFFVKNVWAVPTARLSSGLVRSSFLTTATYSLFDRSVIRTQTKSVIHDLVVFNETTGQIQIPSGSIVVQLKPSHSIDDVAETHNMNVVQLPADLDYRVLTPKQKSDLIQTLTAIRADGRVKSADLEFLPEPMEPH